MGHHDHWGAHRVPVIPAVGVVEQAPPAHRGAGGRQHLPQQLRAAFIDREGQRSPAPGTVTVPASYQPNSSATRVQVGDPGVIAYITGEIFHIDGGQIAGH